MSVRPCPVNKYARVPQSLKDIPNWVVWKLEERDGRKTKVPYDSKTGRKAEADNSATWTTFDRAVAAVEEIGSEYSGIGFEFGESWENNSGFVGIDLDNVIDSRGNLEHYASAIVDVFGKPYIETSPSGTGLHCIAPGRMPEYIKPQQGKHFSAKKQGVSKYGAEMYGGGHFFTITGSAVSSSNDDPPKVDMEIPYFLVSKFPDQRFRRLWTGDTSDYENDKSRADLALMGTLARALSGDTKKMLQFFNASVLGQRPKWVDRDDYRELTINKAISGMAMSSTAWNKLVEQPRKTIQFRSAATLTEEQQKDPQRAKDFTVHPADGQKDGWFPLGSPSLLGGSSGSGKTTFMLDLCVAQLAGTEFFGHRTLRRPYLVLMLDRGRFSHLRTMERMGFMTNQVPIKFLHPAVDGDAAQQIIDRIEETNPRPEIVFIEGMDMLVSDPNSLEVVMPFLHEIQLIAEHFHAAIVGSVGAPKSKPKEGYAAKRDTIFGSAVWSRMAETVVTMQYPNGDDTENRRVVSVLLRNAPAEKFNTEFQQGRLVKIQDPEEDAQLRLTKSQIQAENIRTKVEKAIQDILQGGPQESGFVRDQLREMYGVTSSKTIDEVSAEMVQRKLLIKSNIKGNWLWESTATEETLESIRNPEAREEYSERLF